MKTLVMYRSKDGSLGVYAGPDRERIEVEYDDTAPCVACREPVVEASMGGTDLCPWCDVGNCRFCGQRIFNLNHHVPICGRRPAPAAREGDTPE